MPFNRFRRTISQPTDGSRFFVVFADEGQPNQPDGDYGVFARQISEQKLPAVMAPDEEEGVDRTTTQFRIETVSPLPDGTILEITVVHA